MPYDILVHVITIKFISEGTIDRDMFIATKEVPCCKMITLLSLVQTVVSEKLFIAFQPLERGPNCY